MSNITVESIPSKSNVYVKDVTKNKDKSKKYIPKYISYFNEDDYKVGRKVSQSGNRKWS